MPTDLKPETLSYIQHFFSKLRSLFFVYLILNRTIIHMINLRILFGWVPKTADYEAKQDALRKEFADLKAFSSSKELAEYMELEKTVKSSDFDRKKKQILAQRFSDTPEYRNEKNYLSLKKQRDIQRYYKMKDSSELKDFLEMEGSQDVKHYHTLEKLIGSDEFAQKKRSLGKKFKQS